MSFDMEDVEKQKGKRKQKIEGDENGYRTRSCDACSTLLDDLCFLGVPAPVLPWFFTLRSIPSSSELKSSPSFSSEHGFNSLGRAFLVRGVLDIRVRRKGGMAHLPV